MVVVGGDTKTGITGGQQESNEGPGGPWAVRDGVGWSGGRGGGAQKGQETLRPAIWA